VGRPWRPKYGAPGVPQNFCFSFTAAEGGGFPNGRRRRLEGAALLESDGNTAEGGCFASELSTQQMDNTIFLNKWHHSYRNHSSYQIVTKKEEQNHVAVKS